MNIELAAGNLGVTIHMKTYLGGTGDETSVVEVGPVLDVGAEVATDVTLNEDEGEISVEIVDTATELEMSTGDDIVVTAVVVPVPAGPDELSPRDIVSVPTETVGKPGGSSDVAAVVLCVPFRKHIAIMSLQHPNNTHLEFVYGTDEDAGDPGVEVPLVAELLIPELPADKLLSDGTAGVLVTDKVDLYPGLASESACQPIFCNIL